VVNALENIRSSINVAERGRKMARADDMRELARLSFAEVTDALQVLSEGALKRQIEPDLLSACVRLLVARLALDQARHLRVPQAIDTLLQAAIRNLRAARSELANPSSLPPSFRN